MLDETLGVARTVHAQLHQAELQTATAIREVNRLIAVMYQFQDTVDLGPLFGQDAIDLTALSLHQLSVGMGSLRKAHLACKKHKREAGLSPYEKTGDDGWTEIEPGNEARSGELTPRRHLQVV